MARTVEAEVVDIRESVPQVQEKNQKPESDKAFPSKKLSRWIFVFAAAIAAMVVAQWWLHSQNYESTDDAQIEGRLDLVSARISGTVISVNPGVENNQFVEAGTLLMELDPRDYAPPMLGSATFSKLR